MKILVADDDSTTRKMLEFKLCKWGYEVILCANGNHAWEILQAKDRPSLAILDWNMPGLDGPSICRRVREHNSDWSYVYLFILTARDSKEDTVEGLAAGADDYLVKPIFAHELKTRLDTAKRILDLQESFQVQLGLRHRAEAELGILIQSLEDRVEKRTQEISALLDQKNRFVNQLGHDLKTPLTPLVALLPLLQTRLENPHDREILDLAIENVGYIKDLVTHTIDLARLQAPGYRIQLESIEILGQFDRIVASFGLAMKNKGLKFEWARRESFHIEVDPVQFRIAVENLLSNALSFTPSGGKITLNVQRVEGSGLISITDTGCGIAPDQIVLVFQEFYKADLSRHDRSSSGLGLSIVKEIMNQLGGRIELTSPGPDLGTSATMTFPISHLNSGG